MIPAHIPPMLTATGRGPNTVENQCMWFLKCENEATHTQEHPTLGPVPICDGCQAHYEKNGGQP